MKGLGGMDPEWLPGNRICRGRRQAEALCRCTREHQVVNEEAR